MALSVHDTSFIVSLNNGEPSAYDATYHHFIHPVRHFIEQLVRDPQMAEDIAVDTFVKTFKKNADFHTLDNLKGFLFITAANGAKDYLRRQKRQKEVYDEVSYLSEREEENIEIAYIRTEAATALRESIRNIPGQPGEVMRMIFMEGKTLPQIAEELNIAYNTVQNHRARGIQLLRRQLTGDELLSAAALALALTLLECR